MSIFSNFKLDTQNLQFHFGNTAIPFQQSSSQSSNQPAAFAQLPFGQTNSFLAQKKICESEYITPQQQETKKDTFNKYEPEIKLMKDPKIAEIERKLKENREAKSNAILRSKILNEDDIQNQLKNPILKNLNDKINKICQQADQILIFIESREDNYVFPVSIDAIKTDINRIKEGIKYGNNTASFQRSLSDLGYLCWQSSTQLEQVEIEIKRIEKSISQNDSQETCEESLNADSRRKDINNDHKLKKLNEKMIILKTIFEEFSNDLNKIIEECKSSEDLNLSELRKTLNLVHQDTVTQCFQPSTLISKLENQEEITEKSKSEEFLKERLTMLQSMVLTRLKDLNDILIELDAKQLDRECLNESKKENKTVKGRMDLDLDEFENENEEENLNAGSRSNNKDYHLIHYQNMQNQQKKSTNGTIQQRSFDASSHTSKLQSKSKKKIIEFDLDGSLGDSSDDEKALGNASNIMQSQINPYHTQTSFLQCQSSILNMCEGANGSSQQNSRLMKQSTLKQSTQTVPLDPILYNIQNTVPSVQEPHNIKYRQNMFSSLKNVLKKQSGSSISNGESHTSSQIKSKILTQNQLTPLQYEQLTKTIVQNRPKFVIAESDQHPPKATGQTLLNQAGKPTKPIEPQLNPNIAAKQTQSQANPGIGRMITSIKESNPSPPFGIEVKTQLKKVKSQYSIDEDEDIQNPLSDDSESQSDEDEVIGDLNLQMKNAPSGITLGKKGHSINLSDLGSQEISKVVQKKQDPSKIGGIFMQSQQLAQSTMISFLPKNDQPDQNSNKDTKQAAPSLTGNTTQNPNKQLSQQNNLQLGGVFSNKDKPEQKTDKLPQKQQPTNQPQAEVKPAQIQSQIFASAPPDSPKASEVVKQVQQGLFGKKTDIISTPPLQKVAESQPSAIPKVGNTKIPQQQSKLFAGAPPDSPKASEVQKQVQQGLFGQKVDDNKKPQAPLGAGEMPGLFGAKSNTFAGVPPDSPKASEVQKQVQSGLFGQKVDDNKKPLAPLGAGETSGLFGTKPKVDISATQKSTQQTTPGLLDNKNQSILNKPITASGVKSEETQPGKMFGNLSDASMASKLPIVSQPVIDATNPVDNKTNNSANSSLLKTGGLFGNTPTQGSLFAQTSNQSAVGGMFNFQQDNKQNANQTNKESEDLGNNGLKKKKLSTENNQAQNPNNSINNLSNTFNSLGGFGQNQNQNQNANTNANSNTSMFPSTILQASNEQSKQQVGGLFNNNQGSSNDNQSSMLSGLNYNNPTISSKPLFGANSINQNSSAPFGNTSSVFNTGANNNSGGGLFGFNNSSNPQAVSGGISGLNSSNLTAFSMSNQPSQVSQSGQNSNFGVGNSTFGMLGLNNNAQQNNMSFKTDISKLQFGQNQQQQQQQPQNQQQGGGGNMFSGMYQGGNGLFQTGQSQQGGMFGNNAMTAINMPKVDANSNFCKPRK